MEYIKSLNKSIDYLEENICDNLEIEEAKDRMRYMIAVEEPETDLDFEVEARSIPANS